MNQYRVRWADATSSQHSGWKSASDIIAHLTPSHSDFTGWVLHEDEEYIIFAAHKIGEGDDEAFDGDLCLPRGCIVSMKEVVNVGRDRPEPAAGTRKRVGTKKRSRNRLG